MTSRAAAVLLVAVLVLAPRPSLAEPVVGTYASGVPVASDIAWDDSGNLYASGTTGNVYKIGPGGSPVTVFATGMGIPWGLAFGPTGELYVTDRTSPGKIWKVAADGSSKSVFATGLIDPLYIHFDPAGSGDLFVGEWAARNLKRVSPAGLVTMVAPLLGGPLEEVGDFAFLPGGSIIVGVGGALKVVGAGGSPVTTFATGLGSCSGLRKNDDGSYLVSRGSARDIWLVTAGGAISHYTGFGNSCVDGPISTATFVSPNGMAVRGNLLYIADRSCSMIRTLERTDNPTAVVPTTWGRLKSIYR